MKFTIPGRVHEAPPPMVAPFTGLARQRKIALIGSAATIQFAPWYDPSWEIWAHATVHAFCKRVDRYFDLHPWKWISEKPVPGYLEWLKHNDVPIYMQREFRDVPKSIRYPKERILAEYPNYITSHIGWMIGLALSEGVTHLGFFGIHYALDEEHKKQRSGCEFWMGLAVGKGVQIVNPPGSPLMREPAWLYGYESHDGKTHVREQTGGKNPLMLPPQDVKIVTPKDQSFETLKAAGRVDVPYNEDRHRAQLEGKPPMFNGRPAW